MVSLDVAGTPWRATWRPAEDGTPAGDVTPTPAANPFGVIWILLLWQTAALVVQILAMYMARHGATSVCSTCVGVSHRGSPSRAHYGCSPLSRCREAARNAAVLCLGVVTAVQWRVSDPLLFTGLGRATSPAHVARYFVVPQPISAASTTRCQLALPRPRGGNRRVASARPARDGRSDGHGARSPGRAGPYALRCRRAPNRKPSRGRAGRRCVLGVGPVHLFQLAIRVSDAGVTAGGGCGCLRCPGALV